MFDVACPFGLVHRRYVLTGDLVNLHQHFIDGDAVAASDVEDLSGGSRSSARQQIRFNNILHEREVSRLQAVAVNYGPAILQHRGDELCQNTAVFGARVLPRTEHIEIPQRYGFEAIRAGKNLTIDFTE